MHVPLLPEGHGEGVVGQREEDGVLGDLRRVGGHRRLFLGNDAGDVDRVGDVGGRCAEILLEKFVALGLEFVG